MIEAKFSPGTLEQAKAKANAARESLKDASIPMRQASIYLDRWVQQNFKTEGGKVGGWPPFKYGGRVKTKTKTQLDKEAAEKGFAAAQKRKTAEGKKSAYNRAAQKVYEGYSILGNWQTGKNGAWSFSKIDRSAKLLQDTGLLRISFLPFATMTNAGIGSDLPYSKYHQDGGKHLPQRRMLPEKEEVMADLTEILDNWVKVQIQKANA